MRFPSYSAALAWLYARNQFALKMGLEKTRELLGVVGNPEAGGVYLHVAGTNGKGSVCLALARMLPTLGVQRVGLYTSPHLVSFRERIRVDGQPVPAAFVTAWLNRHIDALERLNPTYFEIVTALAFAWFHECGCEAVVLETGLGGRLDATNVVTPRVTVVTSISLDHVALLGDTVEAIQREKLGIVKPGAPLLVDEARPALARAAEQAAAAVSVPFLNLEGRLGGTATGGRALRGRHRDYTLPPGLRIHEYEWRNAALAVLALEAFHGAALPPESVWAPALGAARMPGRMQRLSPRDARAHVPVLLDAAHNPAGVEALCAALERGLDAPGATAAPGGIAARPRIFFSAMADKDFGALYARLRAVTDDIVFVDLSDDNPRALTAPAFRASQGLPDGAVVRDAGAVRIVKPTREALAPLLNPQTSPPLAVFCGSLFLLGAVIPLLTAWYEGLEEFEALRSGES